MKRISIIVEGPTEQVFCENILQPYFNLKDIYLYPSLIKKSKGGMVHWSNIKKQIENYLRHDKNVYVSTMLDFYGIYDKHNFPGWINSKSFVDKYERKTIVEDSMKEEIEESLRRRFVPYLQLHEFEGLLFSDVDVFKEIYDDEDFNDYDYLIETINMFPNPEMINDGKETVPSVRLKKRILRSYDKVSDGYFIAENIGLEKIRNKCRGFNEWIEKIEEINK